MKAKRWQSNNDEAAAIDGASGDGGGSLREARE